MPIRVNGDRVEINSDGRFAWLRVVRGPDGRMTVEKGGDGAFTATRAELSLFALAIERLVTPEPPERLNCR